MHTHFAVNSANFDSIAKELSGLWAETLAEVAKHLEQEGRVESLTVEQKRVFILLNQVKTIAAKVTGSEAMKIIEILRSGWKESGTGAERVATMESIISTSPANVSQTAGTEKPCRASGRQIQHIGRN